MILQKCPEYNYISNQFFTLFFVLQSRKCPSDRPFQCANGQCLAAVLVCDGKNDCNDGRDEDTAMCKV